MTTTKKLIIAVVALSLVLVGVIGGTLAYLIAESGVVTNTFTYGTITITLTETKGEEKDDSREFSNVVPGDEVEKDPKVTVTSGSEPCYVYVLIDNQLETAATYDIGSTWTMIGESGTKVLYRYSGVVDASNEAKELPVFTTLTFKGSLKVADITALAGKNVVIKAYAHQSDNTTQDVADDAAIAWAGVTASN